MAYYARTSAHALADILRTVREVSPQRGFAKAWAEALDAEIGTVEFNRRHSECFVLLNTTMDAIWGLEERKQARYSGYVHKWWRALTLPDGAWGTTVASDDVITQQSLDILDSLGDVQESAFAATSSAPLGEDLTGIYEACSDLLDLIAESASLPAHVKQVLTVQVDHVRWLVNNVSIFGTSAPVLAAENVIGRVSGASAAIQNPDEKPKWKRRLMALGTAIIVTCGVTQTGAGALESAINAVTGVLESGERLIDAVTHGDQSASPGLSETPQPAPHQD